MHRIWSASSYPIKMQTSRSSVFDEDGFNVERSGRIAWCAYSWQRKRSSEFTVLSTFSTLPSLPFLFALHFINATSFRLVLWSSWYLERQQHSCAGEKLFTIRTKNHVETISIHELLNLSVYNSWSSRFSTSSITENYLTITGE